ncbi:MAG: TrbG/VirB9 family P-type conjugative transfer protein [Alphaproteobacteria bacterium]|nr:TrbG/VirB9 family P-type conjugative transfer protein [Alphaproteobacteria bacterium]
MSTRRVRCPTPVDVLAAANGAARQQPLAGGFTEARHVYAYAPGAIYELYTNPGFISTVLLEPGETINAIASGDTSRWMVTETNGESEGEGRTIVLVKPQTIGLRTNIVLITDRRTYTIEASSSAGAVYSAQIAWSYPAAQGEAGAATARPMNENYRVRTVHGVRPSWLPSRVYDDGRRTWLEFPESVGSADMPPLFVITPEGAELVNYRVQGRRYMVDRIFDVAELRFGTRAPIVVRIERRATRAGQSARS